jgi:tetratricopeptide (TPR) repeat protein
LLLLPGDANLRGKLNRSRVSLRQEVARLLTLAASQEDPASAYDNYGKALALEPENRQARQGAAEAARKAKLVRADPEKVNGYYFKGVYAYADGDTERAIDWWEKALNLDPQHRQANQALQEARRKLKAISELDKKS